MPKKITTESYIIKAKEKHDNKYDYSQVAYSGSRDKIIIGCVLHGTFTQTADVHIRGHGCPTCAKSSTAKCGNRETFIENAIRVHGHIYDYTGTRYINSKTKSKFFCPIDGHGTFYQTPNNHLRGQGCPKCGGTGKLSADSFVRVSNKKHDYAYDYSLAQYVNNKTAIRIVCSKHGEFTQTPQSHMGGCGCPLCADVKTLTTEEFIRRSVTIHGEKYDYASVQYINNKTAVHINCREHGEFTQIPNSHLNGHGCANCHSSKGEATIKEALVSMGCAYEPQKKFQDLGAMRYDFYLPKQRVLIEYDGQQHFHPTRFGGMSWSAAYDHFKGTKNRDILKNEYALKNNLTILRIPYWDIIHIGEIITSLITSNNSIPLTVCKENGFTRIETSEL